MSAERLVGDDKIMVGLRMQAEWDVCQLPILTLPGWWVATYQMSLTLLKFLFLLGEGDKEGVISLSANI